MFLDTLERFTDSICPDDEIDMGDSPMDCESELRVLFGALVRDDAGLVRLAPGSIARHDQMDPVYGSRGWIDVLYRMPLAD